MLTITIFVLSLIIQVLTVILALRLARLAGAKTALLAIAFAAICALAHDGVFLKSALTGEINNLSPVDFMPGLTGVFLFLTILAIKPLLRTMDDSGISAFQNDEKFMTVFEKTPIPMAISDIDGKILRVNRPLCEMMGYSMEELLKMKFMEISHPEDIEKNMINRKRLIEGSIKFFFMEKRYFHKNGNMIWGYLSGALMRDKNDKPLYFINQIQDITERKKAEYERTLLAEAIDQSADIMIITDTDGKIVYVNKTFEKITGYSREEATGKHTRLLKSGKQNENVYRELWETILAGDIWTGKLVNKKKDGSLFEVKSTIFSVVDNSGNKMAFVAVQNDLSQQATLSKAKDYFTAVTAHELRSPLSQMGLAVTLLKETIANKDYENLEQIFAALERAYGLFERITSSTTMLTNLSFGQMDKNFFPVSLGGVVKSCVETANGMIEKEGRNVALIMDNDSFSDDMVTLADKSMIGKAIGELLSNAIKYTPDGKSVKIRGSAENDHLIVEIADEGTGIPENLQNDVCEPYYSTKSHLYHSTGQYKYQGGGIGLGLTLARLIMDYHQGSLDIKNRSDVEGTVVRLRFPVKK